jgi:hypothetical protein
MIGVYLKLSMWMCEFCCLRLWDFGFVLPNLVSSWRWACSSAAMTCVWVSVLTMNQAQLLIPSLNSLFRDPLDRWNLPYSHTHSRLWRSMIRTPRTRTQMSTCQGETEYVRCICEKRWTRKSGLWFGECVLFSCYNMHVSSDCSVQWRRLGFKCN